METSATCNNRELSTIGIQDTQFLKNPKFSVAKKLNDIIVLLQTLEYILGIIYTVFIYWGQLINMLLRYPGYEISYNHFGSKYSRGLKF